MRRLPPRGRPPEAAAKEENIRLIARTPRHLVLVLLGLSMLAAAGCVGISKPEGWAGPACRHPDTECISSQGIADDFLLASTAKGELSALSAQDFSPLWTFPTGEEDPKIELEAIYGTPQVIGDTVYLGAYSGDVYALSLETGEPAWDQPFEADGPIIAGLAASETAVYVASGEGTLYALDPADGREKGHFDAGDSIWATPLLAEGVLYVASVNGKLYALDAETLEPKWDAPFKTGHGLLSDPALADGTVLVGGIDRALHAVDAKTGRELWSFKGDNWFWARPLVADSTVYAPNLDGRLYALGLEDGKPTWDAPFEAEEPLRSAPVLAGDSLLIVDRSGNVYGLDREVDQEERLRWSKLLEKTVLSDPMMLGEEVLISAQGGDLLRLDPVDGTFREVVIP